MKKIFALSIMIPVLAFTTASFAQDAATAAPTTMTATTKADAQKAVAADKTQLKADRAALMTAKKAKDTAAIATAKAAIAADKKQWKADMKTLASFHKTKKDTKKADAMTAPAKN
jgi:hypothetical protein